MYQVIARKHRPRDFDSLIGQEHVRATLAHAIEQGRIAHGYILAGQRGTGKTTVARILARCLNCHSTDKPVAKPCGVCSSCVEISNGNSVDVIEIDAASNRGINEMRELRENVRYRPARDRHKVFIIDEAHQITNEAFNALLKTLEEPPEWVVFVLCTTEVHKIPTTIASRCQQFSFRSVDFKELIEHMKSICAIEGVEAGDDVLAVLAQTGEGSVRDSLSALDQAIACCGSVLDVKQVRSLLGMFSLESLARVTEALEASDAAAMLDVVYELERNGQNLQHFCRELARYFRNLLVSKVLSDSGASASLDRLVSASSAEREKLAATAAKFSEEDLTRFLQLMLDLFKDLQFSLQPRLHVEVGLLRLVHAGRLQPIEEALAGLGGASPKPAAQPKPKPSTNPVKTMAATSQTRIGPPSPDRPPTPEPMPPAPDPEPSPDNPSPIPADLRGQLMKAFEDLGMPFTVDAVAHSIVAEGPGEISFTTPKEYKLAMKEPDLARALQSLGRRGVKIRIAFAETGVAAAVAERKQPEQDEASERALSHPEVQRFQQAFPGAQVRAVRNLKE